uniref:Uncharacterized protein n=1 Tax=Oryza punctata TaxID=4537 RepID=A0A0E0MLX4_ORYPU
MPALGPPASRAPRLTAVLEPAPDAVLLSSSPSTHSSLLWINGFGGSTGGWRKEGAAGGDELVAMDVHFREERSNPDVILPPHSSSSPVKETR